MLEAQQKQNHFRGHGRSRPLPRPRDVYGKAGTVLFDEPGRTLTHYCPSTGAGTQVSYENRHFHLVRSVDGRHRLRMLRDGQEMSLDLGRSSPLPSIAGALTLDQRLYLFNRMFELDSEGRTRGVELAQYLYRNAFLQGLIKKCLPKGEARVKVWIDPGMPRWPEPAKGGRLAPTRSPGETIVMDLSGRDIRADGADGGTSLPIAAPDCHFHLIMWERRSYFLRARHAEGEDFVPLGHESNLVDALERLGHGQRFQLIHLIFATWYTARARARSNTARTYTDAFIEGRLRKSWNPSTGQPEVEVIPRAIRRNVKVQPGPQTHPDMIEACT